MLAPITALFPEFPPLPRIDARLSGPLLLLLLVLLLVLLLLLLWFRLLLSMLLIC